MRCFFHETKEAIAACRKCGKGMCEDCSSYDNHSGICPNCKKEDFKKEISQLYCDIEFIKNSKFWTILKSVLFFWLIIPIFICIKNIKEDNTAIVNKQSRIDYLEQEIIKIENSLKKGSGTI